MLTQHQQELIDGIISEFTTINKQEASKKDNGRFTLASVRKCYSDRDEFIRNIDLHNKAMLDFFCSKVMSDVEQFNQEFGEVLRVRLQREYADISLSNEEMLHQLADRWMEQERHSSAIKAIQIIAYFISKTKTARNDDRWDFERMNIGDAKYFKAYISPDIEWAHKPLEDGSRVSRYKIKGIKYCSKSWLQDDGASTYSSLDEMLQNSKEFQQQIVSIS